MNVGLYSPISQEKKNTSQPDASPRCLVHQASRMPVACTGSLLAALCSLALYYAAQSLRLGEGVRARVCVSAQP